VLRRTTIFEVIERPFTTKPRTYVRRGCQTVRRRCLQYLTILKHQYGVTLAFPLEEAKRVFQDEMGIWDRTSLKAYFGTQPDVSKRVIQRTARYQTGTISQKTIELRQNISKREGYLERLGLVNYEKRGNTWFMILNKEVSVVPQISRIRVQHNERHESRFSIDNFSLSPNLIEVEERGIVVSPCQHKQREKQTTTHIGCERNRSTESNQKRVTQQFTPLEQTILRVAASPTVDFNGPGPPQQSSVSPSNALQPSSPTPRGTLGYGDASLG